MTDPVEPKDAASLILLRDGDGGPEALMGRRQPDASFVPHVYVFPGGRVDAEDGAARAASPLRAPVLELVKKSCDADLAHALAVAAVRETFEETGLLVADEGDVGAAAGESWRRFRDRGLAPALGRLDYVGRAITPEYRPIRFHARFFMARFEETMGALGGDGELLDLRWVPLSRANGLSMLDVTAFMLAEARRLLDAPPGARRKVRWFNYAAGGHRIDYD